MSGSNPVILLGAGRSGTTLLYKLLSAHPNIAYLSNYQNRWPAWPVTALTHRVLNIFPHLMASAWFMGGGGAYFNEGRNWLQSIVPTPAEAESVYRTSGLPLTPDPEFHASSELVRAINSNFEKIRRISGGEVVVTKRTANNRRIPALNKIFPNAKYIHLVRDGRAVAYSLPRVDWWDDHILYWCGKSPKEMVAEGAAPLFLAARNWVEEMKSLQTGLQLIETPNLLEVRYEMLLKKPFEEIQRMVEFIGLESSLPNKYFKLVDSLQLKPREESWLKGWPAEQRKRVEEIQYEHLRRWGYL
ncbi:MAG: sulfotransferase [Porticoccus sp.]